MYLGEINLLWAVVAGVINMVIGFLWYGPLFSKPWMRLQGLTPEKIKEQSQAMGTTYLLSFVMAVVSATVYQWIFLLYNTASLSEALLLAVIVWIGFVFTVMTNRSLFVKAPFALVLIDSGYYLAALLAWSVLYFYFI